MKTVADLIDILRRLDPEIEIMREVDTRGDREDWGIYYVSINDINLEPIKIKEKHNLNYKVYDNYEKIILPLNFSLRRD